MAVVLLDDHLLRDWLVGPDPQLARSLRRNTVATTNLWYVRLCKSAAAQRGGALLGSWPAAQRDAVVEQLVALPESVVIVPFTQLAWRVAQLGAEHPGLSTLGAEAVAAAESHAARILASSRDVSPGIRAACGHLRLRYDTLDR